MFYHLCITLPIARLNALSALLNIIQDQAKIKEMNDEEILWLRLASDMFPLVKQVQIAADNAKGMAFRLGGKEAPAFADTEITIADLQVRIQKTIDFLETFSSEDFSWAEIREARFPYFPGMHMVGEQYLLEYALPNFFFHLTTAYNILRHHGFEIGKKDFMHKLPLLPDVV